MYQEQEPQTGQWDAGFNPDVLWPEVTSPAPARQTPSTIAIPENIREIIQQQNACMLRSLPPDDKRYKEMSDYRHQLLHVLIPPK